MTLAFTICSVNYLAQARTLGDSLRETNPDWTFIIGLVDKLDAAGLPEALYPPYPMLEVDKIGIPDFAGMCDRYDITELNTAVKPFFINYFYDKYPKADKIIYFDPDIIVFQPMNRLTDHLDRYSLVLTPHACSPVDDWERPNDLHHLNTGIFNLGFIGLRNTADARQFVAWWAQRLVYECRIDLCAGLFVDQHWVNFAPVYQDSVWIEKHPGYNVAYWNLHERHFTGSPIEQSGNRGHWLINGTETLFFFHYSGYNPDKPTEISKYQTRYTFAERPDVVSLFRLYRERLLANQNEIYRQYPCVYIKPPRIVRYKRVRKWLKAPLSQLIAVLESGKL
ncbi:hypothetical protein GCM10023189_41420 [Nibrella saemangeumensis]|uniref:Glycosyl transferase n=1 Tax=Nibrella saemangeumensis TaxID=1084526 RepID=A0ABP8NDC7_9BACT